MQFLNFDSISAIKKGIYNNIPIFLWVDLNKQTITRFAILST